MAKRYEQLIELVRKHQPRVIVEIGVHRAVRARKMCQAVVGRVHYIGCDVFETMGAEFQEAALNGKGEPTEAEARKRLDALKSAKPDFTYELIVGDTRKTLKDRKLECDFAFIDGDHRVEAIVSDYLAVENAKVVVFDDFYQASEDGCPDLSVYGANIVLSMIPDDGDRMVEILPMADKCKHGGYSHLAVVYRD